MGDIIIGTRRSPLRRGRTAITATAFAGLSVLVVVFVLRRMIGYPPPTVSVPHLGIGLTLSDSSGHTLTVGPHTLERLGSVDVVRTRGSAVDAGAAIGTMFPLDIERHADQFVKLLHSPVPTSWFGHRAHDAQFRWQHRLLDDGIPGPLKKGLHAMVIASQRSGGHAQYEQLVRAQAALDIGRLAVSPGHGTFRVSARALTITTPSQGPRGDRMLMGRIFSSPALLGARPLVHFHRSDDSIPFVSVTWPGAMGVVTGVNRAGIAIGVHIARTSDIKTERAAIPAPLLARQVLETARTADEAAQLIRDTPILGAAVFVIADGSARRVVVVERSPNTAAIRPGDQHLVTVDLMTTKMFEDDADNDWANRVRPASSRAKRAARLVRGAPSIGATELATVLRDQRTSNGRPTPLGHRGTVDDPLAAHVVIIDPTTMSLWVSNGPGAQGQFHAFDIRHELGDSEGSPAPPASIPVSDSFDPTAARLLAEAAALHDRARREMLRGSIPEAQASAQRAVSHSGELPMALLLAADLAQRTTNSEAARALYQMFLRAPDDLGAVERVKAWLADH